MGVGGELKALFFKSLNCLYSARTYVTDLHSTLGSGKSGIICPLHGVKIAFMGAGT